MTDHSSTIVTQWEITRYFIARNIPVRHSVELRADGEYLDSKGVWEEAKRMFSERGIHHVIVVAQPFLQLSSVKKMVRADGFTVIDEPINAIGFDSSPQNTQPWTRSAPALLLYAVKLVLGRQHGHAGRQSA